MCMISPCPGSFIIRCLWLWLVTDASQLQVPARPQEAASTPARRTLTPRPVLTPPKVRLSKLSEGLFAGGSTLHLSQLHSHGLAPGGVLVEPYWICFGAGNAMSAGRVSPGVFLPMLPLIAFSALMCVCTQEHPVAEWVMLELPGGVWLGLVLNCAVQVPVADAALKSPPTALRQLLAGTGTAGSSSSCG